jgi:hypothetical protein
MAMGMGMRSGLFHTLAFGIAGAAIAGCLLTTSLDGLDDTSAAAGDSGPKTDATEAAKDGSSEGSVGPGGDAGTDAGEAGAPFRCASLSPAPVFCTDFDTGTLASIIDSDTAVGGAIAFDDAVFRSPSRSVRLTAPALAGADVAHAQLRRSFGFTPTTSIRVEFDLKIDSTDPSSSNAISVGMGGYELGLFLGATAKLRQGVPGDGGTAFSATNVTPPAAGTWVHLALTIALVDGASTATLAYDGVASGPLPIVMDQYRASSWLVVVGLNYVDAPDDGRELHIDNLVIDAK